MFITDWYVVVWAVKSVLTSMATAISGEETAFGHLGNPIQSKAFGIVASSQRVCDLR
ncbi:MAG: hypothetical protein AB1589_17745 [Cyanobacteriota bacterium]